ncbi:1-acyl-sn-glycerol-3-phosphate acyltransferase [Streptacidiphilus sp. N1-3]|uniref:1-acyl-sn-glycerol-3-phosphate acyltransferase n=1 Tax=Streptacidiphilus alkalitolerans TaxID=3342712 RepID=A0ABV6WT77_9ACTN
MPLLAALTGPALALLLLSALTSPLTLVVGRRRRLLRFSAYFLLYLLTDLTGVVAACWIWLRCLPLPAASRDARLQTLSYALLARMLGFLRSSAGPVFGLRTTVHPAIPPRGEQPPVPLLVFARHAGPGDSFLLVHALLCEAGLRPQVVLKQFLQWDPSLDILINRVPHCFVPPGGGGAETAREIGALAANLSPGQVVVLFPEGGNFTPQRRRRAIAWLRRTGQFRRAARAQRAQHVLPPRMPGSLALLDGAATAQADVVFVAHTGLDRMDSPASIWHGVPLREPLRAGWWRVPAPDVPAGSGAREEWLTDQWSQVDAWISDEWDRTGRRSD